MGNRDKTKQIGSGSIVILAWPETFVRMVPGWYEKPLRWSRIVRDGKIRAGHAALMLVDHANGDCHYADFGRYITPEGMGRTRTKYSDPELAFPLQAHIDDNGGISNLDDLLLTLQAASDDTHGAGTVYASVNSQIDYQRAYRFVMDLNQRGSIPYDPFAEGSSNCSRFVRDALIESGNDHVRKALRFRSRPTPAPLVNVFWGGNGDIRIGGQDEIRVFDRSKYLTTLFQFFGAPPASSGKVPARPDMIPENAHHLDGVGSVGWFTLSPLTGNALMVTRYHENGSKVFEHAFAPSGDEMIDPDQPYEIIHDTNALFLTVEQHGNHIRYHAALDAV